MKYLYILVFLCSFVACKETETNKKNTEEAVTNELYENPVVTKENTPENTETPQDSIPEHTFKSGETLWDLGRQYYGNRHYSAVLGIYNGIENVHTIEEGTLLKIPAMEVLVKDPAMGMSPMMDSQLEDILEARSLFMKHEKTLSDLRETVEGTALLTLPANVKQDLDKATYLTEDAITSLKMLQETKGAYPRKMVNQLNSMATLLSTLSMGKHDGVYRYDLDMVHQHLVRAFLAGKNWVVDTPNT